MRTRRNVAPGDRVTVEIQHTKRAALRPLIGTLRTVEITAGRRAVIYDDDGRRYRFGGRVVPAVDLVDASIFTDPATGQCWAEVYCLPPRDPRPCPIPAPYAAVVEPDGRGGIARMPSCRCGRCPCPDCGEQAVLVAAGMNWDERLTDGHAHTCRSAQPSQCPAEPLDCPHCCAMPMMLAPTCWVCRRDTTHRRPFHWPTPPSSPTTSGR